MPAEKPGLPGRTLPPGALTHLAPGLYRIVVQGRLSPDWSGRFGAMRVMARSTQAGSDMTELEGRVSDQAELSGILNTLYELHLPLLSVEYLGDDYLSQNL
jgi:hypothetical protein